MHPGKAPVPGVASSFISPEQAELNLQRELANDDFDTTRARAKAAWNHVLSKVEVEGGSIDQVRTVYSSLYRMVQFPNKMDEVDAAGQPVHWSPYNGKVLPGHCAPRERQENKHQRAGQWLRQALHPRRETELPRADDFIANFSSRCCPA
ncbi:glycoside hydrolase domain-containing protein [Vitiosangium sp. GDMCC 1.1324]|uniref:glycoside hydrolase domain-containing protein n=1 Tax=Vitiosangium sp. (strain GDMCC 1.1324) TaxID=2138576 RepID=UPI000D368B66|nr:glycoside hydrolase domain-containing protein [Vitiosangium sp. GDMCC 1.1324]PTL85935.1 hypothetical protein DAT35_04400 [Vitiosangium sp. GDMCC 1.1324]